jgi:hypothetical protein
MNHCKTVPPSHDGECRFAWHNGGLTCAAVAKQKADRDAQAAAEAALNRKKEKVADELGDTPTMCAAAIGLGPERAMLARNKSQLGVEKDKLAELEARAHRMQKVIDAPHKTERSLAERISDSVRSILSGKTPTIDESTAAAAQAAMQIEVEKKAAEAATAELKELQKDLEMQRLRIEHVSAREKRLVDAAIQVELERVGPEYLRAVAQFKKVASLLFAGLKFIGHHEGRLLAELPKPERLDTTRVKPKAFDVSIQSEHDDFFANLAAQLVTDPKSRVDFAKVLN